MSYFFIITCQPKSNSAVKAYLKAHELLKNKKEIIGVFFWQNGIYTAKDTNSHTYKIWQSLEKIYQIPLYICPTTANKRNIKINHPFKSKSLSQILLLLPTCQNHLQFN